MKSIFFYHPKFAYNTIFAREIPVNPLYVHSPNIPSFVLKQIYVHHTTPHASQVHLANIARGTTDPEIGSVTWIKFSNNMAPLALVANLATRLRRLH